MNNILISKIFMIVRIFHYKLFFCKSDLVFLIKTLEFNYTILKIYIYCLLFYLYHIVYTKLKNSYKISIILIHIFKDMIKYRIRFILFKT